MDMWGRSFLFKLVLAGTALAGLLILIVLIYALAILGSVSGQLDTAKQNYYICQNSNYECDQRSKSQADNITQLKQQMANITYQINNLTAVLQILQDIKGNLTQKQQQTEIDLNNTLSYIFWHQIGAYSAGGLVTIGTGALAYEIYVCSSCNSDLSLCQTMSDLANKTITDQISLIALLQKSITDSQQTLDNLTNSLSLCVIDKQKANNDYAKCNISTNQCINDYLNFSDYDLLSQSRLKIVMPSTRDFNILIRNNCTLSKVECFNSAFSGFDQQKLKSQCGKGSVLIEGNTDKTVFGGFFQQPFPTQNDTYLVDPNAFLYAKTNGSFGTLKNSSGTKAFMFPGTGFIQFGEGDVYIANNGSATSQPSQTYSIAAGSDIYFSSPTNVKSIVAYSVNAVCN